MTIRSKSNLLMLLCTLLFSGFEVHALSYDYTASIKCLENPHKPQYGGGIIVNPELNHGLRGWSTFGDAKLQHRQSQVGNKFAVAHSRSQKHAGLSQKTYLQRNKLYTFSAWVQVSGGSGVPVTAIFKTSSGSLIHAGAIVAESNCWSMLKGGLTVSASGPAELYFESKQTSVEIWVDSVSLQPFTEREWKSHHDQSIEKNRKRNVRIQAVDAKGNPLRNATITIQQKAPSFPFGCAMNKNILTNTAYQNWFTSRFGVTTFEDEMKWYSTESSQGKEDYSAADAMLEFAKEQNIAVRGHNVFWDDPQYQLGWLNSLDKRQLALAAYKRLNSIMQRYKGQVNAWDVVNENLHFNFFESKLGSKASAIFYNWAIKADGGATTLFMNDYNTIEESGDGDSTPAKYLQKLRDIQGFPGNNNSRMAIGLESHFRSPNIPYIRSSIDTLSAANLPIWITELDVQSGPNQALYLEQILREVYAHPQIQGIVIWYEWGLFKGGFTSSATTDTNGVFEASLPHGDYKVRITDTESPEHSSSMVERLEVAASTSASQPLLVQLSA